MSRGQNVTITGPYGVTQNLDTLYSGSGDRTALVSATGTVDVPAGAGDGVYAGNFGLWTLTNAGVVRGDDGVYLGLGGSVTNQNEILGRSLNKAGVYLANGGGVNTVVNESGGTITGGSSAAVGGLGLALLSSSATSVVDNSGRIYAYGDGTASRGTAVVLNGGGTVTNRASGVITGGYGGTSGLGVYLFGPGTVENSGAITGNNYQGIAIYGQGAVTNHTGGNITANGATIGVWVTSGTGTVTNETGAAITGGRNGVVISGSGTVTNGGTITGQDASYYGVRFSNTAAGTYTTSVTNDGTISGGAAGVSVRFVPGSGTSTATNTIDNTGTIAATGAAGKGLLIEGTGAFTNQITNGGSITGQVGILSTSGGSDAVTNSGTIIGTGGTAVDLGIGDDTMSLGTGSAITGTINGGNGTDALTLNGTGVIGIDQITNFETLAKEGTGTWTLTGAGSSGGDIAVNGGTLAVAGNVGDRVNVGALGTLKGNGQVGSLTQYGHVTPGSSVGTLAVNGDYLLDDPGTLEIEIGGFDTGESDFLGIAGEANLTGGTIRLRFWDGYDITGDVLPGQSASLMFLEADGGISAFASTISYDFLGTPLGFTYDVFQQDNGLWFQATNSGDPGTNTIPAPGAILLAAIGVGIMSRTMRERNRARS